MNKKALIASLAQVGLAFIPGGAAAKDAIEALTHKDADPDNDVDEIATKLADAIVASVAVAEGIQGRDLVNEPAVIAIKQQIVATIKLVPHVLVKRAA